MGSLSDTGENKCLKKIVRETDSPSYTPGVVYVALCGSTVGDPTGASYIAPSDTSTGANCSELDGTYGYRRTAITFAAPASRRITQTGTVTFPPLTGATGTARHYVIVDHATIGQGNVLAWGTLTETKVLVNGNTPSIASGDIYIQFNDLTDFGLSDYAAEGLLDWLFRAGSFSVTNTYLGAALTVLTHATTGVNVVEPNTGNYARVLVNGVGGASPAWTAVSGNSVTNANIIQFPTVTAPWTNGVNTTVVASFIATSTIGAGQILIYDNGITDQPVGTGDPVLYAQGAFIARIN